MPELQQLGDGQKPLIRPHYPHMLAEDNAVWGRFLKTDAYRIEELWYDVRVGQPVFLGVNATEMEKKIAAGLTRKRIDVVCRVLGDFWVVEVKPLASMLAIGQVFSYARMFAIEYAPDDRVIPVIVCDKVDGDLVDEYEEMGILVMAHEESA